MNLKNNHIRVVVWVCENMKNELFLECTVSTCVCLQNCYGGHVSVCTYLLNNTWQRNYSAGDRIYFPMIMGVPEIGYKKGLSAV